MDTIKRIGFAALFVLGTTLCASAPAQTYQLTPTGAEPSATGQATLAKIKSRGTKEDFPYQWYFYSGYLTVTCQGLTPGATYGIGGFKGTIKAAPDGTLMSFDSQNR